MREGVGATGPAGQPGHRLGPLAREPADHVRLVEELLRIAGEQQPYVGGEAGDALVLLPGEPPRRPAAVVERAPGRGQLAVQLRRPGALPGEFLRGGVVRLGGLLGAPVQLREVGQELGQRPFLRCGVGRRAGRRQYDRGGHRRRTDQTEQAS